MNMSEPLFVFIALAGATLLGFLLSNVMARRRAATLSEENSSLSTNLRDKDAAVIRLQSECEARMNAVENLQRITQDVENQVFEKEKELEVLKKDYSRLKEEVQHLTENPIEKIKEIDVIREVPVLIFKEVSIPETRKDKAKKLMKAFKKGYLDEHEVLDVSEAKTLDEAL